MRLFLSKNAWHHYKNSGVIQDQRCCLKPPNHERGFIEIGKINLVLIALIGVILLTLLSQDHTNTEKEEPPLGMHTQPAAGIVATTAEETPLPQDAPARAMQAEPHAAAQERQKNPEPKSPVPETHAHQATPVSKKTRQPDEAVTETHTAPAPTDTSRHTIVFSIWSVSELRLRSAYTQVMNDGSLTTAQQQLAKKDYLDFVNHRAQKCGDLDNKFASNINTVEKLTFDEKSVKTLECHTSENVSELDRLNTLGLHP